MPPCRDPTACQRRRSSGVAGTHRRLRHAAQSRLSSNTGVRHGFAILWAHIDRRGRCASRSVRAVVPHIGRRQRRHDGGGPESVNVPLLISDAASEDWAAIGVKVLSIALVPQGGGGIVPVYTAPNPDHGEPDRARPDRGTARQRRRPGGNLHRRRAHGERQSRGHHAHRGLDPAIGFAGAPGGCIPPHRFRSCTPPGRAATSRRPSA